METSVGRGKRAAIATYLHSAIVVLVEHECDFLPLERLEHVRH